MEQNRIGNNLLPKVINIALLYLPIFGIFFVAIFIGDSTTMTISGPAYNNLITLYTIFPAISFIFGFLQSQMRFRFFWFFLVLPAILGGFIPSTMLGSFAFARSYAIIYLVISFAGVIIGLLKEKAFQREKGKVKVFLLCLIPGFVLFPIFSSSTFLIFGFIACFIPAQLSARRFWIAPLIVFALYLVLMPVIFLAGIFMITGLPFSMYFPFVVATVLFGVIMGLSVKWLHKLP